MKPLFNKSTNKLANAPAKVASTKRVGDEAELTALHHLQERGLQLLQRNYRTPGRGGGEIDLIMRDADGTCVFVEVRARASDQFGGGAASVGQRKRQRIVFAARHYLLAQRVTPACRFDVVQVQCGVVEWLKAAFDAASYAP